MLKNVAAFLICLVGVTTAVAAERSTVVAKQAASETALAAVRRSDAADRDCRRQAQEAHARRAHAPRCDLFRAFAPFVEARAHWQTLIENYPQDPRVPEALLGIGRSYFLGKVYQDGYVVFNQLVQDYGSTKEGREALNFSAASLLRMGKFAESAARYEEYVNRFPNGERIDTAHLNVIDTLREADKPAEALNWVARTRQRFAGTAIETNAMFAALRLYVAEGEWADAVITADQLLKRTFSKAVLTARRLKLRISKPTVSNKPDEKRKRSQLIWRCRTASSRITVGWQASVWLRLLDHHAPRSLRSVRNA